jgi:hypothetical protein
LVDATDVGEEVAVVADEQDVTGAVGQRLEGALDRDVDDLGRRVAGQRDRLVVHGLEGLDEGHRHAAAGVEEEKGLDVLLPLGTGEGEQPVPSGPLVRVGPPAED